MKRNAILLCLAMGLMTACSESDDELNVPKPQEPVKWPTPLIEKQSDISVTDFPTIPLEMQQTIVEEVFGYGWKWIQSNEILENGYLSKDAYTGRHVYLGDCAFCYIESDNDLYAYIGDNKTRSKGFLYHGIKTDGSRGLLLGCDRPLAVLPWTFFLCVSAVQELNGKWYLSVLEPLDVQWDGKGKQKLKWGYSQFVRLTPAELKQVQEEYTYNYSINY